MEPTFATTVGSFNNRHVKVFFKNGGGCEGRVVLWSDDRSVLLDDDSGNLLCIYNTKENVMMIKVMADKLQDKSVEPVAQSGVEPVDRQCSTVPIVTPVIEPPPPVLDHNEPDVNLRLQKLADLRRLQTTAFRNSIANKLKTFTPTQMMPAYYDQPNFTK
jgi:hypothetical protein